MLPQARFLYRATQPEEVPDGDGVDIILRTRDRPILLRRALQDVVAQEYSHWHIQLINDGGDPALLQAILNEQAAGLAGRFTVRHNAQSVDRPTAINQGLEAGHRPYFVVHDDDDTWDPAFLSATVALLEMAENAALIGAVSLYSRVNERIENGTIVRDSCHPVRLSDDFADLTRQMVLNRLVPIGILFRRSLLDQIGNFNPDMAVGEDWEFSVRALLVGDVGVVRRPLAFHHVRPDGTEGAYRNSINVDSGHVHKRHTMLARNNLIRRAIAAQPDLLGLLQPLMHSVHDNVDEASRRTTHEHKTQSDQLHAVARMITQQHADLAQRMIQQSEAQSQRILTLERELNNLRYFLERALGVQQKCADEPV
jgi:glycosyltransferase involved in cell wall biosynthesis